MFCKNCGKQIYEGSKACPYCGADLAQTVNKNMQIYQVKPEKNKSRTVIIVSIVCVLLVIITVAVVAFLMGQKSNEDDDSDDNDKKTEEVVEYKPERPSYTRVETTENEELTTIVPKEDGRFSVPAKIVRKTDSGTVTYINDKNNQSDERKVALHIAAANDSFVKGDSFYLSSKSITYEKIDNIIKNGTYAKFVYNDEQVIRFDDDRVKFTEVLIAFNGECKDTLIFSLNGTYVGSYDVVKGAQNAKGLSDRVYSSTASE